jgi:hypothetical protein
VGHCLLGCLAPAHRGPFRFQNTELLIAPSRLRGWEPRRKLLLLVTLAPPLLLREWDQRAD